METAILLLAGAVTVASQEVITQYTHWFFVAGILRTAIGVVILLAGKRLLKYAAVDMEERLPLVASAACTILVALVILCVNVPDIFFPRAAAIHQLIIDVKH
jgi:hypothetical protein